MTYSLDNKKLQLSFKFIPKEHTLCFVLLLLIFGPKNDFKCKNLPSKEEIFIIKHSDLQMYVILILNKQKSSIFCVLPLNDPFWLDLWLSNCKLCPEFGRACKLMYLYSLFSLVRHNVINESLQDHTAIQYKYKIFDYQDLFLLKKVIKQPKIGNWKQPEDYST